MAKNHFEGSLLEVDGLSIKVDTKENMACPRCQAAMACVGYGSSNVFLEFHFENGVSVLTNPRVKISSLPGMLEKQNCRPTKLVRFISRRARYACSSGSCTEEYFEDVTTSSTTGLSPKSRNRKTSEK